MSHRRRIPVFFLLLALALVAPRVPARVVDPLGGRETEARYVHDAAFWDAAPPWGQARALLE